MAKKPPSPDGSPAPSRDQPEDLGFAVFKQRASHFLIPDGVSLADVLPHVVPGKTLRRDGPRPPADHVFREVITAAGCELSVKTPSKVVQGKTPEYEVFAVDVERDDGHMTWGCFEPAVPATLLWCLLADELVAPGDTLYVWGDAVTVADAEVMRRVVDLRPC